MKATISWLLVNQDCLIALIFLSSVHKSSRYFGLYNDSDVKAVFGYFLLWKRLNNVSETKEQNNAFN